MGNGTGIEWTDATWNPVTGCTKVSAGCDNCYAELLANRLLRDNYQRRLPVVRSRSNDADPFAVRTWPERLDEPRRWREPRVVFVNSMSDLFHKDIPEPFVRQVFQVMLSEARHHYQILTKRPARAAAFWKRNRDLFGGGPLPYHIWIGTSVESQEVDYRIRHLRRVPASVRFLSCEPLLGPLRIELEGIHWVIVGGESGPVRRPMDLGWARGIRDQCLDLGVPFFFKQVGGRTPKANGRELDGRTWDKRPPLLQESAVTAKNNQIEVVRASVGTDRGTYDDDRYGERSPATDSRWIAPESSQRNEETRGLPRSGSTLHHDLDVPVQGVEEPSEAF